jgi:hypothetical protein
MAAAGLNQNWLCQERKSPSTPLLPLSFSLSLSLDLAVMNLETNEFPSFGGDCETPFKMIARNELRNFLCGISASLTTAAIRGF